MGRRRWMGFMETFVNPTANGGHRLPWYVSYQIINDAIRQSKLHDDGKSILSRIYVSGDEVPERVCSFQTETVFQIHAVYR